MLKSMTGYGRAEGEIDGRRLAVEIKTVNHRFLNFFTRLPPDLQRFESDVQGLIKKYLQRGQVNVFANWDGGPGGSPPVTVNIEAASKAAEALRKAARAAGVQEEITLGHLLAVPAVTSPQAVALEPEELWGSTARLFEAALSELEDLRAREGADLEVDIRRRLAAIATIVDRIEARRPQALEDCRSRLARRVEELVQDVPVDVAAERLAMEVAIFADRSDVAEEVVRLRSHIDKCLEFLDGGGIVGRKLDFLLQEMNRETNTIGSKGSDAEISRLVVEIKSELEKVREQVQNIE